MTDWEENEEEWAKLTPWQKFTDKDISRPEKTWKNRFFWTWPIHIITGERTTRDAKRIVSKPIQGTQKLIPTIQVRTTKFKGETYKNVPLSNSFRVCWYGWLWGWK